MEITKEVKKKKQFKDTKLAAFIRNRIYAHRRFKKRYRRSIEKWKEQVVYVFLTATSSLLIFAVCGILAMSIYRLVWLGEY